MTTTFSPRAAHNTLVQSADPSAAAHRRVTTPTRKSAQPGKGVDLAVVGLATAVVAAAVSFAVLTLGGDPAPVALLPASHPARAVETAATPGVHRLTIPGPVGVAPVPPTWELRP
jgi:hypothetical protein